MNMGEAIRELQVEPIEWPHPVEVQEPAETKECEKIG